MEMSPELKELLGTDNIYYRNIGEETKIMDDETRLNKIREIIIYNVKRSEMSPELKNLLGTDNIYYRNIGEETKIMDDETRLNKIREIIRSIY